MFVSVENGNVALHIMEFDDKWKGKFLHKTATIEMVRKLPSLEISSISI